MAEEKKGSLLKGPLTSEGPLFILMITMWRFLFKRIISGLFTLLVISIVDFVIINLPPGDFVDDLVARMASGGGSGLSLESIEALRARFGLNKPLYQQYFYWISNLMRGDLGLSFEYNTPVGQLLGGDVLITTLAVCGMALILSWLVGVIIGVYSALRPHSILDGFATFLAYLGMSFPHFLLALIVMYIEMRFFQLHDLGGLFSPQYMTAPWTWARVVDFVKHIWLPVIIVGFSDAVTILRLARGSMLDTLGEPYILTARAKGLQEKSVIWKHAFKIAVNPLISYMGFELPRLISGVIITAIVFNLPLIGTFYYKALLTQDMYVAGAVLMFIGILLVVGGLLADVLLALVDPRVRYE